MSRRPSVADYLTAQIELSGKTQQQIAKECGFTNPNVISMIKQGKAKLPLARVGAFAKALGVDPLHLFSMVMDEYEPATWKVIQDQILKQPVLTDNEIEFIQVLRSSAVPNPRLRTAAEKAKLVALVNQLHN